jgi:arylformamidase
MTVRPDPAWLDAQYNNRARVANHAEILQRWAAASALSREKSVCSLDLRYDDSPAATLDVFRTVVPRTRRAPVLVFIHGGWWRALDKSDHSFVAPAFNAAGALVVVPNYALCPAVGIEQIALQMVQALRWTWRNAEVHGGDPSRIVVAGHSAGAHLAAMLLCCRWNDVAPELPARLLTSAMGISGVYDLEPLRQTPFLQVDLRLTPASVRRLSPAFFPRPRGKFCAVAGADESPGFLRQNGLIRDVWGPTAVPACETVPGKNHFTVLESLVDPAGRVHELALRLLGLR